MKGLPAGASPQQHMVCNMCLQSFPVVECTRGGRPVTAYRAILGGCQWCLNAAAITAAASMCTCAAGDPSCRHLEQRSSGSLQGFAEILLRRVPFSLLEAQVRVTLLWCLSQLVEGKTLLLSVVACFGCNQETGGSTVSAASIPPTRNKLRCVLYRCGPTLLKQASHTPGTDLPC